MPNIKLPYFGIIDSLLLEEYYDAEVDFNGRIIQIDLNFENGSIEKSKLEVAKQFIENIRIYDLNNQKYIQNDFENKEGDTVKFYLDNQIEELAEDDLAELIGYNTKSADQPTLLLKNLHLVRVGLYPDSEDQFAIFDYTIGKDLTDYLVVINTDENGNLDYMTMES